MAGKKIFNGSLDVQVDGQTAETWSAILEQFADANIYQTWAYGAVRWGIRNLSHLVIRQDGQVMAAAQLRIVRLPLLPAGVAYLRWGPLVNRVGQTLDPSIVGEMLKWLREEFCQRRGLTLQVVPNTYSGETLSDAYEPARHRSFPHLEITWPRYRTVLVNLESAAEVIRDRFNPKTRRHLKRAEKNGLTVEMSDQPEAYREFLRLYKMMRERKQFETTVDVDEFGQMQLLLAGCARMQTFIARKDGAAIGALVCSRMGNTGIYLLGATNERARDLLASYLLHWHAMLWLKAQGSLYYDLGGIDPEANSGGYEFKSGFGGNEVAQSIPYSFPGGWFSSKLFAFIRWRRRPVVSARLRAPSMTSA
jgi:lipid II:glycine glycyltransferase (peptidoglycan interpeptide bridge formation enzyme)